MIGSLDRVGLSLSASDSASGERMLREDYSATATLFAATVKLGTSG